MGTVTISRAPLVRAHEWLVSHGYKPSRAFGAFWGYDYQTLGVTHGHNTASCGRRLATRLVMGEAVDERIVLGVLVFESDTQWRLDVVGSEQMQAATQMANTIASDLKVDVFVRLREPESRIVCV